jgi:hypothetical protein
MLRSLAFTALLVLIGCAEVSGAQLTLSWIDNSGGVASVRIERRLGSNTIFGAIGDVPPGVTSYVDASVAQGSTYCYRVRAYEAGVISPYSTETCRVVGITVTVSKAGTGSGTISSTPAGINCGTACSAIYPVGTLLTLVATPASGSVFQGWTGSGCAGTGPCSVVGNVPVTVAATFASTLVSRNVAARVNGGVASASSTYSTGYPASAVNNGDRKGVNWGSGGGWRDATTGAFPDWLMVTFNGTKTITEIDVFTLQDNYKAPVDPTLVMTFSLYGITDFQVRYWTGITWDLVPGGTITGSTAVWRRLTFPAVTTNRIMVVVTGALAGSSRIVEVEAWGN